MSINEITILRPDDWHVHLRDGKILEKVVEETSRNFSRAMVMPNLNPSIFCTNDAIKYFNKIKKLIPKKYDFTPIMTLYLNEYTDISDIEYGYKSGIFTAMKLYPQGVTTNSKYGVTNFNSMNSIFEKMSEIGIPLSIHGEISDSNIDIFDREALFIEKILDPLRKRFPQLNIVLEHITTKQAVEYIESNKRICATITPHHLSINRNNIFINSLNPHLYCLPIAKREEDRLSLCNAATSGNAKFFLGTDSAPHLDTQKESSYIHAGIFNARNAIQIVTQIFEKQKSLHNLEKFVSINGALFYKKSLNKAKVTLKKYKFPMNFQKKIQVNNSYISIFDPGFKIFWNYK